MQKNLNRVIAIISSDEHLALWKRFNEDDRRIKDGLKTLKHIKFLCKRFKCPHLFTGDLFHKEGGISNRLLSLTFPFFSSLWDSGSFETFGITGNHDQSQANLTDNPSPSFIQTLGNTFKGFHCVDFKSHDFGDFVIHGIPFLTHDLGLIEYIENLKIDSKKYNVLMIHTTMPGAKDTDGREVHSNIKPNKFEKAILKFDLVLCGHIHKPIHYKVMTTDVVQVGATKHQRLTDEGCELGYWKLYANYRLEFVHLKNYPKFVTLKPGKTAPDTKNFYVIPKKKLDIASKVNNDFGNELNKTALARNYCKEKKIKDKKKRKALIKSLKETE